VIFVPLVLVCCVQCYFPWTVEEKINKSYDHQFTTSEYDIWYYVTPIDAVIKIKIKTNRLK